MKEIIKLIGFFFYFLLFFIALVSFEGILYEKDCKKLIQNGYIADFRLFSDGYLFGCFVTTIHNEEVRYTRSGNFDYGDNEIIMWRMKE